MKTPTFKTCFALKSLALFSFFIFSFSFTKAQTTVTFNTNGSGPNGSVQTWTVPPGVTSATITALGACGDLSGPAPGVGAQIIGICTLIPGNTINIVVGQTPNESPFFTGSGGGGGSFVWDATANKLLIVAGGGGGSASLFSFDGGGNGGTDVVGNTTTNDINSNCAPGGFGGGGGQTTFSGYDGGGGGGYLLAGNSSFTPFSGNGGGLLYGGAGSFPSQNDGGFGGGGGGGGDGGPDGSGGGGGGYNGGGGGQGGFFNFNGGGGGGGASFLNGSLVSANTIGGGDGAVVISYNVSSCSLTTTAAQTTPACFGLTNGNATATPASGTAPYTYSWVNASSTVVSTSNPSGTVLSAGSYTVTVQDANHCSATASVTIQASSPLLDNITSSANVTCIPGYATVTATGGTGPYTYLWNPGGQTNATASGLSAGTYSITVTDANGCPTTPLATLTAKIGTSMLHDSIVPSNLIQNKCGSVNNAQATDGIKGGYGPYSFLWSNSNTNQRQTGLSDGTYTVKVTDKNNCTATASVTITSPPALTGSLTSVTPAKCYLVKDGAATVTAGGGVLPYTYAWTPNVGSTATVSNIGVGAYSVIIRDKNGCTSSTIAITVSQPPAVVVSVSSIIEPTCNGYTNGSATATGSSGFAPYTFTWNPGSYSGTTVTTLSAGSYTVACSDNHGCVAPSPYKFNMNQPGQLRDSVKQPWTCANNLVTATVGVKLGTAPYTYAWSPGGGTKATMAGLTPQNYTIVVKDKNGCSTTISENLTCPPTVLSPDKGDGDGNNGQPQLGPNITVYPNPTNGQFTIAGLEQGQLIEMYDYTGRKVSTITASDITMQINLSSQPNGIYLMRILDKDDNLAGMKKVVKTN